MRIYKRNPVNDLVLSKDCNIQAPKPERSPSTERRRDIARVSKRGGRRNHRVSLLALCGVCFAILFVATFINNYALGGVLRPLLGGFVSRHGRYPDSLIEIRDWLQAQNANVPFAYKWSNYVYVSGLTTNDPPNMPLVLDLRRNILSPASYITADRRVISSDLEPWRYFRVKKYLSLISEGDFTLWTDSIEHNKDLANRVRLLKGDRELLPSEF